jgi:hypothetical protein
MAVFSITIVGPRRIEAINQARAVYNTAAAAEAAAQTPPVAFTPLTREQYLQRVIDSLSRPGAIGSRTRSMLCSRGRKWLRLLPLRLQCARRLARSPQTDPHSRNRSRPASAGFLHF